MRETAFKDQGDVMDALYRVSGQLQAIQMILSPLNVDEVTNDHAFAVRMILEATERDVSALLWAADMPSPVLKLLTEEEG